jgi:(p)ppGpp synthase/HD superfamily hydrolase
MERFPSSLEKAMRIAVRAHAKQTRKESDLPYISHPFMVALKLSALNLAKRACTKNWEKKFLKL